MSRIAMRWKCFCSYDGTDFNGWQSQLDKNTIQDVIEKRLERIFGQDIRIHGSGRTDSGVHANGQVFHFDAEWLHGADRLRMAIQCGIPKTIRVFEVTLVDNAFHARFSATKKRYKYFLLEGESSPFEYRYVWALGRRKIDVDKINSVAANFIGQHDFSMFGAQSDNLIENPVKTMYAMQFERSGNKIIFETIGSGYLYKMVRIMVGCFVQVSLGNMSAEVLNSALNGKNSNGLNFRKECAPACGLFLDRVWYS